MILRSSVHRACAGGGGQAPCNRTRSVRPHLLHSRYLGVPRWIRQDERADPGPAPGRDPPHHKGEHGQRDAQQDANRQADQDVRAHEGEREDTDDAGGQGWDGATLRWGDNSFTVRSVGDAPALPASLEVDGPAVVVDRHLLAQAIGHDIGASQAWVVGPDAPSRLVEALAGTDARVVTRSGWLAEQAARPVTRALAGLFVGAGVVALALAALAVALLAASGSRARSIALAQLRAAGTPRAAAARVAWLEAAAPTVIASAVGIATGLGLAGLLVAALGLTSVTGGLHAPGLVMPWWTLAIPVVLGLVARVAVAVAAVPHRAERLGLMMRAG
jgi:hypothetical protein